MGAEKFRQTPEDTQPGSAPQIASRQELAAICCAAVRRIRLRSLPKISSDSNSGGDTRRPLPPPAPDRTRRAA